MPEKNHWLLRTNLVAASKMPSTKMCLGSSLEQVKHPSAFWLRIVLREGGIIIYICCICNMFFFGEASPHTSTPNVSSVHHADSRGSLVSTDSGNSLLDKNSDKTNSLEKVASYINHNSPPQMAVSLHKCWRSVSSFSVCNFLQKQLIIMFLLSFVLSLILGFFWPACEFTNPVMHWLRGYHDNQIRLPAGDRPVLWEHECWTNPVKFDLVWRYLENHCSPPPELLRPLSFCNFPTPKGEIYQKAHS